MQKSSSLFNPIFPVSVFLLIISCLFCNVSMATPSVSFVAGTTAGWDFHELEGDIARNNTIDLNDLNVIAQHWLASGCGDANQWCTGADIDTSTGVDFIDYAILAKDWSEQGAGDVLLQTIYGTAQDSAGNIIYPNGYHALSQGKECLMVFAVPQATALNIGWFKLVGFKAGYTFRVRLFDVTGQGLLNTGHTIVKSNLDLWTPLFDVTVPTGSSVPSHVEGTQNVTDLIVNFGPLEIPVGEYMIAFNNVSGGFTIGSIVRGSGSAVADSMGRYGDGTPLPKRATVTGTAGAGNTYFYYLSATSSTSYQSASNLLAFQLTTAVINYPPVVSAGPDQTVIYPVDTVNLDGTVTDDGIPNPPGAVTTLWTVTSGPGTVTFGDANAVDTTATFSMPGIYVLRLTANDGALSTYDETPITYRQNQAPAVNAGPDQTVGILDVTGLDGAVTDDGLPNPPAAVTTTWTQQSGTGTATFSNANVVDTTVTFSETGTYVLRLTASDSALEGFDEVTITCVAGSLNQPPVVNAGPDQTITLPDSASLDGTVTDDGKPNPPGAVTTLWTKQSGPGTVTFGNASLIDTTASFSVDGAYVLRLTASDSTLTNYDEVAITVNPQGVVPDYIKLVGHFHTTNSDGSQTLEQMMLKYRDDPNEPRDAACVTDHDYISNSAAYSTSTFLGINGVECSTAPHVVGFGVSGSGSVNYGSTLQAEINNVIANGGVPWVAHAQWSYDNMGYDMPTLLASMTNCNLMAVYNHYCQVLWRNGNSEAYWDQLLSSGKRIWGVAEEDTHGWGNKCGFAVTMVDANAFTLNAIKDALTNGKMYFYVSSNRWVPCMELISYTVSGTTPGSTISITVGGALVPPVTIKFIGNSGTVLKTVTGTSGSYTITGTENYVRTKVNDSSVSKESNPANYPPTTIWTQPVWVTP